MSDVSVLETRISEIKTELENNKVHVKSLKAELKKSQSVLEYLKGLV